MCVNHRPCQIRVPSYPSWCLSWEPRWRWRGNLHAGRLNLMTWSSHADQSGGSESSMVLLVVGFEQQGINGWACGPPRRRNRLRPGYVLVSTRRCDWREFATETPRNNIHPGPKFQWHSPWHLQGGFSFLSRPAHSLIETMPCSAPGSVPMAGFEFRPRTVHSPYVPALS